MILSRAMFVMLRLLPSLRRAGTALASIAMFCVLPLHAQRGNAPWSLTLTPTMNPLPIGVCGAVWLVVKDASGRDAPRNPLGYRISIADFDLSVKSEDPRAVVGKYDGTNSFAACACQAAKAGSSASIVATYPARALEERARVPGVRIDTTVPFTIKSAMGDREPPGCAELRAAPAAAPPGISVAVLPPAPVSLAPAPSAPVLDRGGTSALAPPLAEAPAGTAPRAAPGAISRGTPPTGVVVTGVPLIARLSWTATPNAIRYAVWRGAGPNVSVERSRPGFTDTQFVDTLPDPRPAYRYTVVAHYADGTSGEAAAAPFTSPALVNPAGFTVRDRGKGNVDLHWQPVPGAVRYRLDGPGIPGTGFHTKDTSTSWPLVPAGPQTWKVTALYPGNFADYPGASIASAVIHVLPPHATRWLTKSNGPGTLAQVQMPANPFDPQHPCSEYHVGCTGDDAGQVNVGVAPGDLAPYGYSAGPLSWLNRVPSENWTRTGMKRWLDVKLTLWNETNYHGEADAAYGNPLDLGVGRRANCAQEMKGAPHPGLKTVCYASAYGVAPGHAGFADPATITYTLDRYGSAVDANGNGNLLLTMVIVKDPTGTSFFVFSNSGPNNYTLSPTVTLDTEGPKIVPFACLSCHGGTYNASTRKVDGASLLPLDPNLLAFESPAAQAASEEKIRQINLMIHKAQPSSAIAAYLNGLYNGAIATAGTRAQADFVPAAWLPQAGFYRSVVRPHCAMCHLAAQPSWNFASWENFEANKALIRADVCTAHTMPHAEIPFKSFWTKDSGPIFLPGLLAATLGYPSC